MPETLLVTGGLGFVGSHFVRLAVEAGRQVVVLDDRSGGDAQEPPAGVPVITGDIGDRRLVDELLVRHAVSGVVHFAGKIQVGESVRVPERYFDVNLVRSLVLLEAVRAAGVKHFIFSSTAAVYGTPEVVPIREDARLQPLSPYGASKLGIEYALAACGVAHGLRWGALRYFNAAGAHPEGQLVEAHQPETHLVPLAIDAALGRTPPLVVFGDDYPTPDGTCIRDYVHVLDLVEAHLLALARLEAGEVVGALNLGGGRGTSVREVLVATGAVLEREVPYTIGPRRPGDPESLVADTSLAQRVLGWVPGRSNITTIVADAARPRRRG